MVVKREVLDLLFYFGKTYLQSRIFCHYKQSGLKIRETILPYLLLLQRSGFYDIWLASLPMTKNVAMYAMKRGTIKDKKVAEKNAKLYVLGCFSIIKVTGPSLTSSTSM